MTRNRRIKNRRAGAFVIGVILVMIVAATLVMAFTRSLISQNRTSRVRSQHRQASWIAESALDRAAARLAGDPGYQGETWSIPDVEVKGGAEVKIELLPADGDTKSRRIRVLAKHPLKSDTPASVETIIMLIPSPQGDE